jgi:hypothetical protein
MYGQVQVAPVCWWGLNYVAKTNKWLSYRVGMKLPTVEVRYKNLSVEAECEVVQGKPLPTLWNTIASFLSVSWLFC